MTGSGQPPARVPRFGAVVTALAVLLVFLATPIWADCECGYAVGIDNQKYVFTDLIETDFSRFEDIAGNTDWVRQEFNVSDSRARGDFGEMFAVRNIFTQTKQEPPGLQLVVRANTVEDMVPVAEIDTARLDIVFGSYRVGLQVTDVPGTCSAFFWVSWSRYLQS